MPAAAIGHFHAQRRADECAGKSKVEGLVVRLQPQRDGGPVHVGAQLAQLGAVHQRERRFHPQRGSLQDLHGGCPLGHGKGRDAGLDNARLLGGDQLDGTAEDVHVVHADAANAYRSGLRHVIGAVPEAPQARFQHDPVHTRVPEAGKGQGGELLEGRKRTNVVQAWANRMQEADDGYAAGELAIDAQALSKGVDVRARKQAHLHAGPSEHGVAERGGRPFAICAGDMNYAERLLGMSHGREEAVEARPVFLGRGVARAVPRCEEYVAHGLLVGRGNTLLVISGHRLACIYGTYHVRWNGRGVDRSTPLVNGLAGIRGAPAAEPTVPRAPNTMGSLVYSPSSQPPSAAPREGGGSARAARGGRSMRLAPSAAAAAWPACSARLARCGSPQRAPRKGRCA